jgi:hypothetical protein
VEWTAPISEEKAEFTIAGNIVDGDHQPREDDDWAINSYSSESDKLIPDDKIKQLIGVIIVISIFIVPIFLLWKKSR